MAAFMRLPNFRMERIYSENNDSKEYWEASLTSWRIDCLKKAKRFYSSMLVNVIESPRSEPEKRSISGQLIIKILAIDLKDIKPGYGQLQSWIDAEEFEPVSFKSREGGAVKDVELCLMLKNSTTWHLLVSTTTGHAMAMQRIRLKYLETYLLEKLKTYDSSSITVDLIPQGSMTIKVSYDPNSKKKSQGLQRSNAVIIDKYIKKEGHNLKSSFATSMVRCACCLKSIFASSFYACESKIIFSSIHSLDCKMSMHRACSKNILTTCAIGLFVNVNTLSSP